VQQLYDSPARTSQEPDALAGVLGDAPRSASSVRDDFPERIRKRGGRVLVVNDEAHHTHEDNEWMRAIYRLDANVAVAAQLDFTATPRFTAGALFPWTAFDYPLRKAIEDDIVKRPLKGVASFEEAQSDHAPTRYGGFLVAGVERWREYRDSLAPTGRRPVLFIMLTNTREVDDVAEWLRKQYPDDFGGDKTLPIHVNLRGHGGDETA
jgi:type III restriction enzyme